MQDHLNKTTIGPQQNVEDLSTIKDGQIISALICMTDITGFARISQSENMETLYKLLQNFALITSKKIEGTAGKIIKYIGDSSLIIFPENSVDEGVNVLLELKNELEGFFKENGYNNKITFSMHFGEVIAGKFPPIDNFDILGDTINIAFMLDRGNYRGRFIITPQVFRKLKPETRKKFHKFTPPVVYLAE